MVSSVDQEQLLEIQLIAEARSSQIDMLSKEKYTLQRQLDEKIIEVLLTVLIVLITFSYLMKELVEKRKRL